jgi:hypothetical protein
MANFLERAIERMIGDGIITEEELQQRIEEEREKSPIIALQNENKVLSEDSAFFFYDSMAKDFKIQELEQSNADLTYLVMMGGM